MVILLGKSIWRIQWWYFRNCMTDHWWPTGGRQWSKIQRDWNTSCDISFERKFYAFYDGDIKNFIKNSCEVKILNCQFFREEENSGNRTTDSDLRANFNRFASGEWIFSEPCLHRFYRWKFLPKAQSEKFRENKKSKTRKKEEREREKGRKIREY